MTIPIPQSQSVAHVPFVPGGLRRLAVATVVDGLLPVPAADVLSCGRGVEAMVLAMLDGQHALYKVGKRLEERGMITLLQPELTRASRHADWLGPILDALFAAKLNTVLSAVALKALAVYALSTPWLHQDTTTLTRYGAYKDEPKYPDAPPGAWA